MGALTKEICKEHLDAWLEADAAVATGQSYQIGGRSLTRVNATEIKRQIEYWNGKLIEAENAEKARGRNRVYSFVPRDM